MTGKSISGLTWPYSPFDLCARGPRFSYSALRPSTARRERQWNHERCFGLHLQGIGEVTVPDSPFPFRFLCVAKDLPACVSPPHGPCRLSFAHNFQPALPHLPLIGETTIAESRPKPGSFRVHVHEPPTCRRSLATLELHFKRPSPPKRYPACQLHQQPPRRTATTHA